MTRQTGRDINLSMVNIKIASGTVGVVLGLMLTLLPCMAADKHETKETQLPPPPKELEVLDVYIGTWTEEIVLRPNRIFPDGLTGKKEWTAKRILNDQFIEVVGTTTYATGVVEDRELYTFDRALGKYRLWNFDSGASTSEWTGKYDGSTQSIKWEAVNLPDGRKAVVETRLSADKTTGRARVWTGEGTLDFDSSSTAVRVKKKAPDSPNPGK